MEITYHQAVAMAIVDGEMEVLSVGRWRQIPMGTHPYRVRAEAARNLPPGDFILTREENRLRLAWHSDRPHAGGRIVREITLPHPTATKTK